MNSQSRLDLWGLNPLRPPYSCNCVCRTLSQAVQKSVSGWLNLLNYEPLLLLNVNSLVTNWRSRSKQSRHHGVTITFIPSEWVGWVTNGGRLYAVDSVAVVNHQAWDINCRWYIDTTYTVSSHKDVQPTPEHFTTAVSGRHYKNVSTLTFKLCEQGIEMSFRPTPVAPLLFKLPIKSRGWQLH